MFCYATEGLTQIIETTPLPAQRFNHTATLLPNGEVLVASGTGPFAAGDVSTSYIFNPVTQKWRFPISASTGKGGPNLSAVLMNTGEVLMFGNSKFGASTASKLNARVFNPYTDLWRQTSDMLQARSNGQTATLLQDGRVLVVGGVDEIDNDVFRYLRHSELYNPATSSWSAGNTLSVSRSQHTATRLNDGQVVVTGGLTTTEFAVNVTEVFQPGSNSWVIRGNLNTPRYGHTATLLRNGKILVVGGTTTDDSKTATCELYDPVTNTWTTTAGIVDGRSGHTATLLPNGKVMIYGGGSVRTQLFDPTDNTWSYSFSNTDPVGHTATLLANGDVVIIAGFFGTGVRSETYIFHYGLVSGGSWNTTDGLDQSRHSHTATLLPDGQVLAVGGRSGGTMRNSTEKFNPATNSWSNTANLLAGRFGHTATLLANGEVLVVGGLGAGLAFLSSAERYNPNTNTWSSAGSTITPRVDHTATLLDDGTVAIIGGRLGNGSRLASVEVYDPSNNSWAVGQSLNTARSQHSANIMPNGWLLVAGGRNGGVAIDSTEVIGDPKSIQPWNLTEPLNTARFNHVATIMASGELMVSGGVNASNQHLNTSEVSVSTSNISTVTAWNETGNSFSGARADHTATLLPGYDILLVGGSDISTVYEGAHRYDLAIEHENLAWQGGGLLNAARVLHTATLLPNGKVLVAGGIGSGFSTALASAELFSLNTDFVAAAQPNINSMPDEIQVASTTTLTGERFTSMAEGSHSNTSASSSDHPIVTLRHQDSGVISVLKALPVANGTTPLWSDGFATVQIPAQSRFNGPTWFTVSVNGIRSEAVYHRIGFSSSDESEEACFVIPTKNGAVVAFCL